MAVNAAAAKRAAERLSTATAAFINAIKPANLWVTQDWHPKGHKSFKSEHSANTITETAYGPYALGFYKVNSFASNENAGAGRGGKRLWKDPMVPNPADQYLWPDHCLQNEEGSDAHVNKTFEDALDAAERSKIVVVRKGDDPSVDNYSALASVGGKFLPYVVKTVEDLTKPDAEVDKTLKFKHVLDADAAKLDIIYVTGIARNVCVKSTFLDLLNYVTIPQFKKTGKVTKAVFMYNLARPVAASFDISVEDLAKLASTLLTDMGIDAARHADFFEVVGDGKTYSFDEVLPHAGAKGVIVVDLQDCFLPGGTLATGNARNEMAGGRRCRCMRRHKGHCKQTRRSRCNCGKTRKHKKQRSCK